MLSEKKLNIITPEYTVQSSQNPTMIREHLPPDKFSKLIIRMTGLP